MKPNFQGFIEPRMWPQDGGTRREPVMDMDVKPRRAVRYVGWRKCMRCGQLFWSDDVLRASLHPATEPARMQEQARRRRHLKNPAPPLSSSAVQWRAVPEKLRRPIENRWTLIKRTQSGTEPLLPVRSGLQRVPLAPVVVCAAGATITTLPSLGYWRAWHAACSGTHASEGRTTNTELGGRDGRKTCCRCG